MRVAVDAMGGDNAPQTIIEGVRLFRSEDEHTEILLVGRRDALEAPCADLNVTIVDAPSVVGMHESASTALKTRKDSSIAVATGLMKAKQADALLTMGNSGAAVAFAMFVLGRLPNISKPAIVAPFPSGNETGVTHVLDCGATVDCKPSQLLQFALMGSAYCKYTFNVESPRIGLLSIGEEDSKGNELTLATSKLLKEAPLNFIGNVEGVDIMRGGADVVVCDGFIGNVILKFGEGLVETFFKALTQETDEVLGSDLNAEDRRTFLTETMQRVDYSAYGGAELLGVNGHLLIGHGRSAAHAIANGIRSARNVAERCPLNKIQQALEAVQAPPA
ncbi:MAG: phosphate acyltransferase PlsX [Candidatus Hinthialibacter antarcticus]|nr:phosphate acyltransferase PlsX [Candidatus Hinthialibacter antarcticus]